MSIEHTPPSTYILRDLFDVTVPDSVSWMPQTIGWKILATALIILAAFLAYRRLLFWWHNRYRNEAIAAINNLNTDDQNFEDSLYSILKVVLVYLEPAYGRLFGQSFLQQLDRLGDVKVVFDDGQGLKWTQSLVDPSTVLNAEERTRLQRKAVTWVKSHPSHHRQRETQNGFIAKLVTRRKEQGEGRHV
ncbi:DUF4381 domain-containing protein [Photobacterium rosenbergii]|uniref:DUF4381 domain-containing protein n=1 Tax=Photobacterium rosenbergii TaxID=294936 RepID=A0ABU3ZEW2_9GAMM|nr:DUF4381 domain-containing protein [Photobacterium rosenbergii]MDV5168640.1 DUF4381 domain-containing protein [Photobacterium rosenbergii]